LAAFNLDTWHDFLSTQAAAGAALAGLVFVAISMNLARVLSSRAVSGRAVEALLLLLSLLIVGLLGLIPEQSTMALGIELIVFGLVMTVSLVRIGSGAASVGGATRGQYVMRLCLGQLASLPIIIAGISFITGDGGGLYWVALSTIVAVLAGMIGAWVLLVEILR
jgi:modulator of FtsH protease